MAPNRRKGANKAAAALAARRKWKVGDLVLAKVKGFPAWPATVSEPQKWGYPADLKKVVVFFFGTQQIAFCNPADVEEFTEEKKVSLLGKRHGKGADFVRAVKEISDSYDELKKHEQISSANGTEETNNTSGNHPERSLNKYVENECPIVDPPSGEATNDLNSLTEAAVAAEAMDALPGEGIHEDEPSNSVLMETPVPSSYSTRNKTDVSRSRNSGSQWTRKLRSFLRINGSIFPPVNSSRASRRSGVQDRSLRRSRRFMKSSDDSEGRDDSLAVVSNDSTEESDSEIMMADSAMRSVNAGSTDDFGCKFMDTELFVEKNVDAIESNVKIDFQANFVFKRRSIPAPKGHNIDMMESTKLEAIASDVKVLNNGCISPRFSEKLAQRNAKDDSDEHLPFAKRARVRLGKPSSAPKEEIPSALKEDHMLIVPENPTAQSPEPMSWKVDVSADENFSPTRENLANSSLPCASLAKIPQLRETGKNFVDGEAALPPSKRLHRALEAMCANAAEDCDKASYYSPAAGIQRNEPCPVAESSELSLAKNVVVELRSGAVEDLSNGDSPLSTSMLCASPNLEMSGHNVKSNVVSDCGQTGCLESTNILYELTECADSKHLQRSPLNGVCSENSTEHHLKPDSIDTGEQLNHSNCDTLVLAVTHQCENELAELNGKGSDTNNSQMNSDSVFVKEIAVGSPNIGNSAIVDSNFANGETEKMKCLPLAENKQDTGSDFVKASQPSSMDPSLMLTVSPAKISARSRRQFLVRLNSVSHDHMDDRTMSVTQSSSSLTDGPDSVARASPPSSSICNISVSDITNNTYENNSSCSPDVRLHLEKAKLAGKSSSKWESLSSFEKFIKSLTRTKESIGRATRMAIDCAKSGLATKVVDILVHNLESESNLHRKVDLFFLVDSITQCSRGMKGDCVVYPSAIQTLLPRLLLAAAPPGSSSHENQRQCLKVLRVWQERKILPEPIIRHHIQQLDALCGSYPIISSRRPLRNERAFDDPIREMEGMLVDEYGSNSTIQLSGFCMPPMLKGDDGGSESDGEGFEAVTPEHNVENGNEDKSPSHAVQKRSHILEDVDGELEMEDVAPCCEVDGNGVGEDPHMQMPHHQYNNCCGASLITHPKDVPPAVASVSGSPLPLPPPPPPPHPPPPPPTGLNPVPNGHDSKPYSCSQNFNRNSQDSFASQSVLPRVVPTPVDTGYHRVHENNFEDQVPRWMPDSSNACLSGDRSNSHLSGPASSIVLPTDVCTKVFHLRPPQPSPSNQFSYVQEPRVQSWREVSHPHPSQFRSCNAENGNLYRDYDRSEFAPRDNIGECWRPPHPPVSGPGPYYPDQARMVNTPIYNGPPRDPALLNNRWNVPPPPMNQGHFHPYRPPMDGPIHVANRDATVTERRIGGNLFVPLYILVQQFCGCQLEDDQKLFGRDVLSIKLPISLLIKVLNQILSMRLFICYFSTSQVGQNDLCRRLHHKEDVHSRFPA